MLSRTAALRESVAAYGRELGGEPALVLCLSTSLLVLSHHHGSVHFFRTHFGGDFAAHPASAALGYFWWFASAVILYLGVPLAASRLFRGSFHRRYGFGLGDWRTGLAISALFLAIMLPLTTWAAGLSAFRGAYPLAGQGAYTLHLGDGQTRTSLPLFVLYELGYLAYFVAWEFHFRGWMLNALLPTWGRGPAILVQMVPFAIMHLGKPELETLGSIVAGIALGVLALRTRSFWYGVAIHGAVAIWMDVLAVRGATLW